MVPVLTGLRSWSLLLRRLSLTRHGEIAPLGDLSPFALAAFLVSRYVPMVLGALGGKPLMAEAREGVTMFWSIVLLDLGIVLPATIATAVGVLAGARWGRKALYTLVGWWAFVPASVAAMAIAMVANDDPQADVGQTVVFVAAAALFAGFAARSYRASPVGGQ